MLRKIRTRTEQLADVARRAGEVMAGSGTIGVKGRLARPDEIDFRCSRHRARDAISTEKVWKIPASWGRCAVYVSGAPGTTFTLVEYAPEPAPGPAPDETPKD